MSELTTGGINFGYQSPIHQIVGDISTQIIQDGENQIFQAIQKSNIVVDKDELIKALQYDRNQYDKGYSDGRASIIEEFEKIKAEIENKQNEVIGINQKANFQNENDYGLYYGYESSIGIIDKHIAELKGE